MITESQIAIIKERMLAHTPPAEQLITSTVIDIACDTFNKMEGMANSFERMANAFEKLSKE